MAAQRRRRPEAEREALGLTGRLPSAVLTLDQQAQRVYRQLAVQGSDLAKNTFLEQLREAAIATGYVTPADLGRLVDPAAMAGQPHDGDG
jgi:hypothetical protein